MGIIADVVMTQMLIFPFFFLCITSQSFLLLISLMIMIWPFASPRKRKRALMSDDESGDEAKKRKSDDDEDCKEVLTFSFKKTIFMMIGEKNTIMKA